MHAPSLKSKNLAIKTTRGGAIDNSSVGVASDLLASSAESGGADLFLDAIIYYEWREAIALLMYEETFTSGTCVPFPFREIYPTLDGLLYSQTSGQTVTVLPRRAFIAISE